MKIAMIGHKRVPSRLGGVEVHVEEIAARLAARGHEVHLYNRDIYGKDAGPYRGTLLKPVFTVKKNSLEALIYSIIASVQTAFGSYDIVHFHALGPSVMSFIPRLAGKKVVCTVHGLDWKRAKWKGLATRYLKLGEYATARFPHATISVSKTLVPYYQKKYGTSVTYIQNGINLKPEEPLGSLAASMNIEKDSYFLFVARLVPEKGCHYLLDAFRQVTTDKKLIIAGDNPYNQEYTALLREKAAADPRVSLVGFQDEETLQRLYANAYTYVLPSDIEGLPISLLEAMSQGCLCLVSDIEENLAVVENHGLSFRQGNVESLRDALTDLLREEARHRECFQPQVLKAHIQKTYDWDTVTMETEKIYRQLTNQKG
ncbi:glycosyltransferase family 4 protein [Anoxynatronum buryatiense]|uniref:Glycosyltransferase involved in cell wall bisynthesis n=1 Tax=Anoxynatronum buryatiense TaxID=489973 RepID=A0AA45WW10_9CLOT|nr:glycosyltransferase family 4 protein [Anoxynatronum buryatiense]SMP54882.1 Glycosyltransferase involved in cell wall bisynthesis [Anoxynatronum buryatiense]